MKLVFSQLPDRRMNLHIPLACKHSSAENLRLSVFRLRLTQEGVNMSFAVAVSAGSFTGKLDHISVKAAQQHLQRGAPDTPLCNRNGEHSITLTPQATGSTVCVLNVHSLSWCGDRSMSNREQEEIKQVGFISHTECAIWKHYIWNVYGCSCSKNKTSRI